MPANTHLMQCMEVWGGNQLFDSNVQLMGVDAWVYSRPYHDQTDGGDVHYVSSCATGRITRLLIADVSGHGDAVGKIATELRTLMRKNVNRIEQNSFVEAMNAQFSALSEAGSFATAVVSTFYAPTRELVLCNAGHPPPLIHRASTGRWAFLEARDERGQLTNLPLGIDAELPDYEEVRMDLDVGDLVLVYTDALPEARDDEGTFLGMNGLLDIVQDVDGGTPERVIHAILDRITQRQAGALIEDDVTMLLFRPNGSGGHVRLRDKLLAPLRIANGVRQSAFGAGPLPLPEMSVRNVFGSMIDALGKLRARPKS